MRAFALAEAWGAGRIGVGVRSLGAGGAAHVATAGDVTGAFRLASVTKPLFAYAVLVAVEEGSLALDEACGPAGSTVRHLLAHAAGLAPAERRTLTEPARSRIYSNAGYELLGQHLEARTGFTAADYVAAAVFEPLGMDATVLTGSPAHGASSTVEDLLRFVAELQAPTVISPRTLHDATSVQFPGLSGVLPGFGPQSPNDWGLGFELRGTKAPHWTAPSGSPGTFGHFGRTGTLLWVDPDAGVACVALTDREFGPWAVQAWPAFSAAVLSELRREPS